MSFIPWIFKTGPSNLENFLTCDYFLRFFLLSISLFLTSTLLPFRIVVLFRKLERFDATEIFELQHTSIYYSRSTVRSHSDGYSGLPCGATLVIAYRGTAIVGTYGVVRYHSMRDYSLTISIPRLAFLFWFAKYQIFDFLGSSTISHCFQTLPRTRGGIRHSGSSEYLIKICLSEVFSL